MARDRRRSARAFAQRHRRTPVPPVGSGFSLDRRQSQGDPRRGERQPVLRSGDLVHLPRDRPERKLLMRTLVLLFAARARRGVHSGACSCGRAFGRLGPTAALRVAVQPAVVNLYERSTITVSGLDSRSLQVRLAGRDVRRRSAASVAVARSRGRGLAGQAPDSRSARPLPDRAPHGAGPLLSSTRTCSFASSSPEHSARPAFDDPAEAVRWWVRTVPHATLVALKAWPLPAFDRRDIRLHRLFVVAYSPLGLSGRQRSAGHVRHGGPGRVPRRLAAPRGDCRAAMRLFTPTVG